MITVNMSSINTITEELISVKGTDDLGMTANVNIMTSHVVMNAIRITLQMLSGYPDSVLPPSTSGVMKASSELTKYVNDIDADGGATNAGLRIYRNGEMVKMLINSMEYTSLVNTDYHRWYSSKSLLMVNITIDNCESIIKKLNKLYPYEQFSPENEPCYGFITS